MSLPAFIDLSVEEQVRH